MDELIDLALGDHREKLRTTTVFDTNLLAERASGAKAARTGARPTGPAHRGDGRALAGAGDQPAQPAIASSAHCVSSAMRCRTRCRRRFIERSSSSNPSSCSSRCTVAAARMALCRTARNTLDPYTGSDALASALCMDKVLFKRMLRLKDIPTPSFHSFNETAFRELGGARTFPKLLRGARLPVVVKPVAQGSAIGIKFVGAPRAGPGRDPRRLRLRRQGARRGACLGSELAVTVLQAARIPPRPSSLPIVELHTPRELLQLRSPLHDRRGPPGGSRGTVRRGARPGRASGEGQLTCLMGCSDFARVDLILDEQRTPQVLEINTIPGLTETGITTAAAEAAGMTFAELVAAIVERVTSV